MRLRKDLFDKLQELPLSFFEPMLRRLMAQPRQSIYKAAMKAA